MAEGNGTTRCSDDHCRRYSILNKLNNCQSHHMVLSDDPLDDLLDGTQFCEAFFHVPKVFIGYDDKGNENKKNDMQCLDKESCKVFDKDDKLQKQQQQQQQQQENKERKEIRQPKHVVCFVVLKRGENDVKYKAIYENCAITDNKKHAEEFFDDDARNGKLKEILEGLDDIDGLSARMKDVKIKQNSSQAAPSESNKLKLCMYITLQPCHKSTQRAKAKNCTDTLIKFYEKNLKPRHIEFVVKPTFIYKAYWSQTKEKTLTTLEIDNAKEGLRLLFEKGIEIQAMKEDDWSFLKGELCPSVELFPPGSPYEDSERKKLDDFIRGFLGDIKAQATTRGSATQATARSSTTQASTSSSTTHPTTSNLPNTTPCICKNMCVQKDGTKKKGCPCKTAGKCCDEACKCGTPGKPCKNKKNG